MLGAVLVPIGLVAIVLFASSQQKLDDEVDQAVGGMMIGGLLIGGPLLLVELNSRVFVTPDRVTKFSPFFGTKSLEWAEVTGLDYSLSGRYTVVQGEGGRAIKVSDYMDGNDALTAALQESRSGRTGRRSRAEPDRDE